MFINSDVYSRLFYAKLAQIRLTALVEVKNYSTTIFGPSKDAGNLLFYYGFPVMVHVFSFSQIPTFLLTHHSKRHPIYATFSLADSFCDV